MELEYRKDFNTISAAEQKEFLEKVIKRYEGYIQQGLFLCRKTKANSYYNSEDAYQDVILRLIKTVRNYNPEKGGFDTYMRANIYLDVIKFESTHSNAAKRQRFGAAVKGKRLDFVGMKAAETVPAEQTLEDLVLYIPLEFEEEMERRRYKKELHGIFDLIAEGYTPTDAQELTSKQTGIPFKEIYNEYWRFAMNCRNFKKRMEKKPRLQRAG